MVKMSAGPDCRAIAHGTKKLLIAVVAAISLFTFCRSGTRQSVRCNLRTRACRIVNASSTAGRQLRGWKRKVKTLARPDQSPRLKTKLR
jgi:hypothetical protein